MDTTDVFWKANNNQDNFAETNTSFANYSTMETDNKSYLVAVLDFDKGIAPVSPKFHREEQITNAKRLDTLILSCLLCVIVVSVFQRINFLLKLCLMTLTAIVQITVYTCVLNPLRHLNPQLPTTKNSSIFVYGVESSYSEWPTWLEPVLLMTLLIVLLHLLDRQIELTSRSDFLWMTKLNSEEEGGDTMLGINKVIIR